MFTLFNGVLFYTFNDKALPAYAIFNEELKF